MANLLCNSVVTNEANRGQFESPLFSCLLGILHGVWTCVSEDNRWGGTIHGQGGGPPPTFWYAPVIRTLILISVILMLNFFSFFSLGTSKSDYEEVMHLTWDKSLDDTSLPYFLFIVFLTLPSFSPPSPPPSPHLQPKTHPPSNFFQLLYQIQEINNRRARGCRRFWGNLWFMMTGNN